MTNSDAAFASHADVATDQPARYAKQLVSHLGRKLDFATDGNVSTASIGTGTGKVSVRVGALTLHAEAPDQDALTTVEHVLGSHLLRFATRAQLTVDWTRTAP